ncbi:hypothetical protein B0T26DRAFT_677977 [Lasiosphaeria miniovina]|uniref:Uncharacterized protein n=1 Tax=Lasiosphaeria miniovina TaxID=1954250 RepID=A0AA40ADH1_9PEZI|nr:uncharacterized protein B0T26DRAFT_677977 [Lasiosphaeria miniovina]KAK0713668.1 hypothetical protein B0T26DRAFT_677977 [Lasiosphaeria miniovina]
MTSAKLLVLLGALAASAQATDYFFRFVGGNAVTHGQRLRLNNSIPLISPGVTAAPYNDADHFSRISVVDASPSTLFVVPTNPHPPPVPGYYGLSGAEGVPDTFRLLQSYHPADEPAPFLYQAWELVTKCDGSALLRYANDPYDERRWVAVKETTQAGVVRWVPWWIKPTAENFATLAAWDLEVADLELVVATGPVASNAPGGVVE